jgi:hypothetical protein
MYVFPVAFEINPILAAKMYNIVKNHDCNIGFAELLMILSSPW